MDAARPLEEQVGEAEALVPSMGRITRAVIEAAPNLKLIVQFGAGLEGVDLEAARSARHPGAQRGRRQRAGGGGAGRSS